MSRGGRRAARAALVVTLMGATACGGPDEKESGARSSGSPSTTAAASGSSGGGSPSTTAPGGAASSGKGGDATSSNGDKGSASSHSGGGANATTRTTVVLPMDVTLAHACVRHGSQQVVTVRTTPGSALSYDTTYSDGSNGLTARHGGTGTGLVGPNGEWTGAFAVAPTAPEGKATVTVLASDADARSGMRAVDFTVAKATGACP